MYNFAIILFIFFLLFSFKHYAQDPLPPDDVLNYKLDSIVAEANTLYLLITTKQIALERASRNAFIKNNYGQSLSYFRGDTIISILTSKNNVEVCIYEAVFYENYHEPKYENYRQRNTNKYELNLINIQNKLLNHVKNNSFLYGLEMPKGTSLEFVIFPFDNFYKIYILTYAKNLKFIPFGNDYLFIVNSNAEVINWRKFHHVFIPLHLSQANDKQVLSYIHSHPKDEPYITATDICIFRLYAHIHKLKELKVYSMAFRKVFSYNVEKNKIFVADHKKD